MSLDWKFLNFDKETTVLQKGKNITIQVLPDHKDLYKDVFAKAALDVELKVEEQIPPFTDYIKTKTKQPDMYLISLDSAWFEDMALISFIVNAGIFGMSKPEQEQWMKKQMIENEAKTFDSLRKSFVDAADRHEFQFIEINNVMLHLEDKNLLESLRAISGKW